MNTCILQFLTVFHYVAPRLFFPCDSHLTSTGFPTVFTQNGGFWGLDIVQKYETQISYLVSKHSNQSDLIHCDYFLNILLSYHIIFCTSLLES